MVLPDKFRNGKLGHEKQALSPVIQASRSAEDPRDILSRSLMSDQRVKGTLTMHKPKSDGDDLPEPSRDIPDYSTYTPDQRVEALESFRVFFGMVKMRSPEQTPPVVDDHSDLRKLHIQENVYRRHLSIKRKAGKQKNYLVGFWALTELFFSWLGLNIKGFTESQVSSMGSYDEMLMNSSSMAYRHTDSIDLESDNDWSPTSRAWWMSVKSLLYTIGVAIVCIVLSKIGVSEELTRKWIPQVSAWMNADGAETGDSAHDKVSRLAAIATSENPAVEMATNLGSLFE